MQVSYKAVGLLALAFFAGMSFLVSGTDSIFAEEISFGEVEQRLTGADLTETNLNETLNKDTILFYGDVMLARDVERRMNQSGSAYPFQYTNIPTGTAYAVANFESAVPINHIITPNNTFRFSTKKEFLPALHEAGFTHVSLANNHAFDSGLAGYNNTISELWNNDIAPFGHPTVVSSSSVAFVELDDVRVALVAIHTLFTEPKRDDVASVLAYAAEESDKQIVYIHWGEEYINLQNTTQREYATFLVSAGADMVVGHHPHVVQGVELIAGVPIFYSLGNYIFDQYFSPEAQEGLVLSMTYREGLQVGLWPVSSAESKIQPQPMATAKRAEFLSKLATLSSPELTEQILTGQLIF
jgi:hypothetical protein